ncbi:hypothetical protein, partial [Novosphingobium sp. SCN 63-17]|uniref:hypothetical protein n=1 Tax=Novosphingobium sp. SCN 63-17 TaxID=1660120 RepID=UPI0025E5590E
RSTNERYRGTNLFNGNPLLVNPTTVGYGTVYDDLTVTGSSATVANAKIETIAGKRFQTAEVTLTGAGYGTINIPFNPTATGLNVSSGDIYGFECDTFLAGLNGSTPTLSTENQRLTINNSVGSGSIVVDTTMIEGSSYGFQIPAGQQFIRHMVFPPLVFGDNAANLLTSSSWFFRVTPSDGAGMAFKLGVANPRIVKLNQAVTTI